MPGKTAESFRISILETARRWGGHPLQATLRGSGTVKHRGKFLRSYWSG